MDDLEKRRLGEIRVRIHASMIRVLQSGTVSAPEQTLLGELVEDLGLRPVANFFLLVNGSAARPETPLSDGDDVSVFPLMSGG